MVAGGGEEGGCRVHDSRARSPAPLELLRHPCTLRHLPFLPSLAMRTSCSDTHLRSCLQRHEDPELFPARFMTVDFSVFVVTKKYAKPELFIYLFNFFFLSLHFESGTGIRFKAIKLTRKQNQ